MIATSSVEIDEEWKTVTTTKWGSISVQAQDLITLNSIRLVMSNGFIRASRIAQVSLKNLQTKRSYLVYYM
jgi:hypothetical protein